MNACNIVTANTFSANGTKLFVCLYILDKDWPLYVQKGNVEANNAMLLEVHVIDLAYVECQ
jgi:hypothetical protein